VADGTLSADVWRLGEHVEGVAEARPLDLGRVLQRHPVIEACARCEDLDSVLHLLGLLVLVAFDVPLTIVQAGVERLADELEHRVVRLAASIALGLSGDRREHPHIETPLNHLRSDGCSEEREHWDVLADVGYHPTLDFAGSRAALKRAARVERIRERVVDLK
jgi:hypothetical protein